MENIPPGGVGEGFYTHRLEEGDTGNKGNSEVYVFLNNANDGNIWMLGTTSGVIGCEKPHHFPRIITIHVL